MTVFAVGIELDGEGTHPLPGAEAHTARTSCSRAKPCAIASRLPRMPASRSRRSTIPSSPPEW